MDAHPPEATAAADPAALAGLADRISTYARVIQLLAAQAAEAARRGDPSGALEMLRCGDHAIRALPVLYAAAVQENRSG